MVDDRRLHPGDVAGVGVVVLLARLVRLAEADEVGGDDPQAGCGEERDHLAVQVAPRRLTVHREHDRPVGGTLVEIVDPERATRFAGVLIVDLDVVRRERVVGEIDEAIIGCAE